MTGKKEEIIPVLFLTLIVLISTIALVKVNDITEPKIEEEKEKEIEKMLKEYFPDIDKYEEDTDIEIFKVFSKDGLIGYAFTTKASGYGGDIEILVALKNETILQGISIIKHSETPGLGAKITEKSFYGQFEGISIYDVELADDGGEIDAITGATISSSAVVDAVKDSVKEKMQLLKETEKKGD